MTASGLVNLFVILFFLFLWIVNKNYKGDLNNLKIAIFMLLILVVAIYSFLKGK